MATLTSGMKNGKRYWSIQYRDKRNRRYAISLSASQFNEKTANALKDVVEKLLYCIENDQIPDKRVTTWIDSASPALQKKLAKVGLIERHQSHSCRELWDSFFAQKTGIKESTWKTYEDARSRFFSFFNEDDYLDELTKEQMEEMKKALLASLAESTVAGTLSKAKAVFNWGVRAKWIQASPLDGVKKGRFDNREKDRDVTMEEYFQLLEFCPCQEWRTIISLARIGGLRPSEILALRWQDVDWQNARFYARSRKTEHHQGKEGRFVPIFSLLKEELECLWFREESVETMEYVINRYSNREKTNLCTQFDRISTLAGIGKINRPFDNMRASRANEVERRFGPYLESQWIGHTRKTARRHYMMVREVDFAEAVNWTEPRPTANVPAMPSIPQRPMEPALIGH